MKAHILRIAQLGFVLMLICALQSCVVTQQAPAEKPRLTIDFLDGVTGTAAQYQMWREQCRATDRETTGKSLLGSVKVWQRALARNRFAPFGGVVRAHYGGRSFLLGKDSPLPQWVYTESGSSAPTSQPSSAPVARGGRAEFEQELEKIQRSGGGMTEMSITYPDGTRRDFPRR